MTNMSDEMMEHRIGSPDRKAWALHPCGKYVEVTVPDGVPPGDAFLGLCARKGWLADQPPANRIASAEDVTAYNLELRKRRPAPIRGAAPSPGEPVPILVEPKVERPPVDSPASRGRRTARR